MAKTPPRKPRVRQTVRPLEMPEVMPGGVGAVLSSGAHGVPTVATKDEETANARDAKIRKRERFLALARARFQMSAEAEAELRTDMLKDLEFYNSDQWPDHIKAARDLDKRPTLTINRLPQFVRQVLNQMQQSRPAIQVNPVDNGADPDTAEVLQGIVRNIERNSRAHIAYSTAGQAQIIMGRGWVRVLTEYAADDSFEQEIRIRRIQDAFTVYGDPAGSEPDGSDAVFGFVAERVLREEFRQRYGEEAMALAGGGFQSIGDQAPMWADARTIQVVEYFYIEPTQTTIAECLVRLKGSDAYTKVTLDEKAIKPENLADGTITIVKRRATTRKQLKWALITGVDVLEGNDDLTCGRDLPGPYIPLVPVIGEELIVNGKKTLRGMVRDAKDPQRAYNFWVSAETELIALAPRAPVIGAFGQFEGFKEKWNQAHVRNFPFLEYNPVSADGRLVPPPQRNPFDVNIAPIVQATLQADRDLKSVLGMFDASQEQSQEQSGKAIIARQRQGEQGTSHFLENLARSIEQVGRILVHWIPVYYSKPRQMRIIGLDEQPKDVLVHAGNEDAAQAELANTEKLDPKLGVILSDRLYDIGVGRYDVTISVGPSYESRRQETVASLVQLVQAYPALMPILGDILVGNMDWPAAKQAAKRLEKIVPPEVREKQPGELEIPPEVQQQMAAMAQQLEALTAALGEKDEIIRAKAQELAAQGAIKQAEIASKERIESLKAELEFHRLKAEGKQEAMLLVLEAKLEEHARQIERRYEMYRDEKLADREDARESLAAARSESSAS